MNLNGQNKFYDEVYCSSLLLFCCIQHCTWISSTKININKELEEKDLLSDFISRIVTNQDKFDVEILALKLAAVQAIAEAAKADPCFIRNCLPGEK